MPRHRGFKFIKARPAGEFVRAGVPSPLDWEYGPLGLRMGGLRLSANGAHIHQPRPAAWEYRRR
jgi:hypothetical protein